MKNGTHPSYVSEPSSNSRQASSPPPGSARLIANGPSGRAGGREPPSYRGDLRELDELRPAGDVAFEQCRHRGGVALQRIHAERGQRLLGVVGGTDLAMPGGK